MNVLWVVAHPEPESLTAALHREGVDEMRAAGHQVEVSDLYAMGWKAVVDGADFPDEPAPRTVTRASRRAYDEGTLSADIRAEHSKLNRADALVVQFPLWWYGMPAILKGWFDRVFVKGFAYGVHDPERPHRTLRYGDGNLAGKRALVLLAAGSPEPALGPRGINGQLDQVLFPLLHGTLFYTGMSVLPPAIVHGADRLDAQGYRDAVALTRRRAREIGTAEPLPFRRQNGGDYDDDLILRPHLAPDRTGLDVHYATEPFPGRGSVTMIGR